MQHIFREFSFYVNRTQNAINSIVQSGAYPTYESEYRGRSWPSINKTYTGWTCICVETILKKRFTTNFGFWLREINGGTMEAGGSGINEHSLLVRLWKKNVAERSHWQHSKQALFQLTHEDNMIMSINVTNLTLYDTFSPFIGNIRNSCILVPQQ